MYFSTLVAFAVLPFLVGGIPVSPKTSRAKGIRTIPLTQRSVTRSHIDQNAARSNERRFVSENFTVSSTGIFVATALIGTPAVAYNVLIETGIADTWISGVNCQNCSGHLTYDNTLSSTATDTKQASFINELSGIVTGEVVSDMISIAGGHVNTTFLVATNIDTAFQSPNFQADGTVALGFKAASGLKQNSWFDGAVANGDTEGDDVIGLAFSSAGSGPVLVFGGTDDSKISGSLTYIPLTKNTEFWEIPIDSVTVGNNDIHITLKTAIIASGLTFIQGSSDDIANLHNNIPGSAPDPTNSATGLYTVPCDSTAVVNLTFRGQAISIPPENYIQDPSPVGPGLCKSAFVNETGPKYWFLGTPFMIATYIELDHKNLQVGIGIPA